eukprot:8614022-Heterocapsa_arctica.AAC.1
MCQKQLAQLRRGFHSGDMSPGRARGDVDVHRAMGEMRHATDMPDELVSATIAMRGPCRRQ